VTSTTLSNLPRDRHIRRSGDDYTTALLSLLPQGQAWPRDPSSTLVGACDGLSQYWGYVDGRAGDLLERESDPRQTIELLADWEKAWGLPDPCLPSATTIAERQRMLVLIMTWLGGQSRAYFQYVMNWLGYSITIQEFAPFMAGISRVGETRPTTFDGGGHVVIDTSKNFRWYIAPPEIRFYWTIKVGQVGLTWFRAASGQAGVDHHLKLSVPQELQCLLERWKPAQTEIVMDFSSLAFGGPLQGTP
jgi:uncharacterized protein YmfQ (DUF2313 family)